MSSPSVPATPPHLVPSISAASLVSLWGDELPEAGPGRVGNVKMPGREEKATLTSLATHALAMTVWDLSQRGALSFTTSHKKGIFTTSHEVVLTPLAAGPGFSGLLLAAAAKVVEKSRNKPTSMRSLVTFMQGTTTSPYALFLTKSHADLISHGLMQPNAAPKPMNILRAVAGLDSATPTPEAQRLRGEWEGLKGRWQAWKVAYPDVAEDLLKASSASLAYAKDND